MDRENEKKNKKTEKKEKQTKRTDEGWTIYTWNKEICASLAPGACEMCMSYKWALFRHLMVVGTEGVFFGRSTWLWAGTVGKIQVSLWSSGGVLSIFSRNMCNCDFVSTVFDQYREKQKTEKELGLHIQKV